MDMNIPFPGWAVAIAKIEAAQNTSCAIMLDTYSASNSISLVRRKLNLFYLAFGKTGIFKWKYRMSDCLQIRPSPL